MLMKVYDSDDFAEYLDLKTIKLKDNKNIFEVEEIVDFKNPRKLASDESYISMRVKAQYNLEHRLRKSISKIACADAMGGGTVILNDDKEGSWEEITSDSNNEKKFELLMRNKKNKD
ncbi:MAG: hypothetical protein CBC01_03455 [Betaproteobacteria bacterium TMED41]|nr:MAG: hypothetical protein CBC01_03455 [Betaproteobacteria bacterium TMED41]